MDVWRTTVDPDTCDLQFMLNNQRVTLASCIKQNESRPRQMLATPAVCLIRVRNGFIDCLGVLMATQSATKVIEGVSC